PSRRRLVDRPPGLDRHRTGGLGQHPGGDGLRPAVVAGAVRRSGGHDGPLRRGALAGRPCRGRAAVDLRPDRPVHRLLGRAGGAGRPAGPPVPGRLSMARWAWMLGGLIVWTVHFMGVYAIASLADVVSRADDPAWRM